MPYVIPFIEFTKLFHDLSPISMHTEDCIAAPTPVLQVSMSNFPIPPSVKSVLEL